MFRYNRIRVVKFCKLIFKQSKQHLLSISIIFPLWSTNRNRKRTASSELKSEPCFIIFFPKPNKIMNIAQKNNKIKIATKNLLYQFASLLSLSLSYLYKTAFSQHRIHKLNNVVCPLYFSRSSSWISAELHIIPISKGLHVLSYLVDNLLSIMMFLLKFSPTAGLNFTIDMHNNKLFLQKLDTSGAGV